MNFKEPSPLHLSLFMLLVLGLLIWAIGDFQKQNYKTSTRLGWLLLIMLVPALGPILYLIFRKKSK